MVPFVQLKERENTHGGVLANDEKSCPERALDIDGTVVSMANVENLLQIILLVLNVKTNRN